MRAAVLHPGEMGATVAQTLVNSGHEVCWVAEGRSQASAARAASLTRLASLEALRDVDFVVSVCPPSAALEQAERVAGTGYAGLYLDANAVAPATSLRVAKLFGASYVDGGIIGPPARSAGTTRLYLAGERAEEAAEHFAAGPLAANAFSREPTAASALKMAYAAFTKGSSALLLLVNALAERAGVRDALLEEWAISQPGVAERSEKTARGTSRKAWRFVGEMEEIASTFRAFGLPGEFHDGAAALYARMSALKDLPPANLERVLEAIFAETD